MNILNILGEITIETFYYIEDALLNLECDKKSKTLYVFIDSEGGDLNLGFKIYELLKKTKCKVVTVNIGHAYSTAAIIFLAGNERYALPKTEFLVHQAAMQPKNGSVFPIYKLLKEIKQLETENKHIVKILEKNTLLEKDEIKEIFLNKKEAIAFVFDEEKAKENGFIEKIIKNVSEL